MTPGQEFGGHVIVSLQCHLALLSLHELKGRTRFKKKKEEKSNSPGVIVTLINIMYLPLTEYRQFIHVISFIMATLQDGCFNSYLIVSNTDSVYYVPAL